MIYQIAFWQLLRERGQRLFVAANRLFSEHTLNRYQRFAMG